MEKIQGNIEITGNKDDKYTWKVEGRKIKIHINGFSDLHRTFTRCEHCNGAYQSPTILKQHILKYHYRKPKSKPKVPESDEPKASTSKAAAEAEKNRWVKKKVPKSDRKRKEKYSNSVNTSDSEISNGSESSNGNSDYGSDDDFVGSGRKKFKKLVRNSDYSDEGSG